MRIGIPRERYSGEKRVATTPDVARQLIDLGYDVSIETNAGSAAHFTDAAFVEAGCAIEVDRASLFSASDIILKVRAPDDDEVNLFRAGQTVIGFLWPAQNPDLLEALRAKDVTAMSMDSVPRISRAQKMDALSSMANIGGYRALVEAAQHFPRFFTGQITAAGRIPPAKVMVIGAGVAGLSAIGTAKSMGAIVRAFDTRPEVKEQVESMDAEFLELDYEEEEDGAGQGGYAKVMSKAFIEAEMALFAEQAKEVDIIVTTALIPGKPAPRLITKEMVESMKQGSVIVDLAAERGGNCELTRPNEVHHEHGVTMIGYSDLPSRMATQSSQLYASNLRHLITDMTPEKDGQLVNDFEDEVVRGATVTKGGETTWPPPAPKLSAAPPKPTVAATPSVNAEPPERSVWGPVIAAVVGVAALLGLGHVAPADFMAHFTVFVLACFVGYMVIWNVSPALHTPLMSVTNAISSIIVIGALLQVDSSNPVVIGMAALAVFITSINIFGGFAVTQRMLRMFQK